MSDRIQADSGILSPARSFDLAPLYEIEPGLCSMALFIPILKSPTQMEPILVDERRLFIGPSFNEYHSQEQAFLVAHAVLHFALGHPARRRQFLNRADGLLAEQVWTLASDAIVNDALSHVKTLMVPIGEVTMDDILRFFPAARTLSLEQLYTALLQFAVKNAKMMQLHLHALTQHHRLDQKTDSDQPGDSDVTPEEWRERLKRGFGRHPAGFERLLGHLPQTETRWEHILRSAVARQIGERTYTDPSRPHRRWLAMQRPMRAKGIVLPFIPGTFPRPQPRIAVAIDTSASIDVSLLSLFMAEIAAIMRQHGAGCRVITADAAVHQIRDFSRANDLLGFSPAGGGGTDFDPAIKSAAEYNPSVLVYFTDLVAPIPQKPRFPVIWALPKTANIPEHPFGRRIELNRRP